MVGVDAGVGQQQHKRGGHFFPLGNALVVGWCQGHKLVGHGEVRSVAGVYFHVVRAAAGLVGQGFGSGVHAGGAQVLVVRYQAPQQVAGVPLGPGKKVLHNKIG